MCTGTLSRLTCCHGNSVPATPARLASLARNNRTKIRKPKIRNSLMNSYDTYILSKKKSRLTGFQIYPFTIIPRSQPANKRQTGNGKQKANGKHKANGKQTANSKGETANVKQTANGKQKAQQGKKRVGTVRGNKLRVAKSLANAKRKWQFCNYWGIPLGSLAPHC